MISKHEFEQAQRLYQKVYKDLPDSSAKKLVQDQLSQIHNEASQVTLSEAMCSKNYRKATWVVFVTNLFVTGSGIDAILTYSTRLLLNLQSATEGQFPVSPTLGTCLIGVSLFVTSLIPIFTLERFGRKSLMLFG